MIVKLHKRSLQNPAYRFAIIRGLRPLYGFETGLYCHQHAFCDSQKMPANILTRSLKFESKDWFFHSKLGVLHSSFPISLTSTFGVRRSSFIISYFPYFDIRRSAFFIHHFLFPLLRHSAFIIRYSSFPKVLPAHNNMQRISIWYRIR